MILVGKYGEIKVNEDNTATAVISNPLLAKRYGQLVQFESEHLETWIKRLKISGTEDGSIRFSNWPTN